MNTPLRLIHATILLTIALATGCRSSDHSSGFAALMDDQSVDVTADESTQAEPTEIALVSSEAGEDSVRTASASAPVMRTLQSGENLIEIVESAPGTVLVDFYADWCGPCQIQGKVLHAEESFAAKQGAQIIKVDVDQHKSLASQFQVESLPTLLVIKNGKVVDRQMGLQKASAIRQMLQ